MVSSKVFFYTFCAITTGLVNKSILIEKNDFINHSNFKNQSCKLKVFIEFIFNFIHLL